MYKIFNHKNRMSGFTLLELLVVMAILAAVAGTATIALKDTDARAAAAAHVAMMDELNKGVHTYRVLKRNELPNRFDSLMQLGATDTTDAVRAGSTAASGDNLLGWDAADAATVALDADTVAVLGDAGINTLMYIDTTATGADHDCVDVNETIQSRTNAVVANNIFMSPEANGCGSPEALVAGSIVTVWTGGSERLTGTPDATATYNDDGNPVYIQLGVGPSCTLFNTRELGGMTTVPVYRHVGGDQYGRFIAIFEVGTWDTGAIEAIDQVEFIGVVDGALDTKEEELGEWDGTRNTI
ncbi:MAG TPA: hypothetical protein DCM28_15050 [Phycisphaerales bacterium]|nr:hypothetical protein [Phycisphaerales bacterium]HCD33661.1 hypothetical protein [Phycisphaerales bacterium]|tara:strand:- start:20925 stop:21818 length:894 start_codon:yes stop_codon:yes gene_type:complete